MEISQSDFRLVAEFMLKNYGINLENKMALISGRLSGEATKSGYNSIHDYVTHALSDPKGAELSQLVTKLTTNYTYFMREPQHYDFLRSTALPELVSANRPAGEIKIWSAGCSSGEEPYSIAITIRKFLQASSPMRTALIYATDISDTAMARAREGIYDSAQVRTLDKTTLSEFFETLPDGRYRISREIRQMVRLEKLNLMSSFPVAYRRFDIVFCRNVMIYFKNDTKRELAARYYDALEPGGYLFVGLSESLHNIETRFQFVKPAIYRKV